MSIIRIDKDKFLRSFKVQESQAFDLFLGSGASVASSIPTGKALILHFKREILISRGKINSKKFSDLKIEANKKIIESFFDDSDIENPYSYYFEEFLEHHEDRRDFLTHILKDKKPSIGFLCLASLIESLKVNTVWTTNFDDLIEKALHNLSYQSCQIVSPENANSVNNFRKDIPTVVKLHGDFRYDSLQNTEKELQTLEENLHNYFIESAGRRGLLVIGYSGSDQSVMKSLEKALENPNAFPKGIVWCLPKGVKPSQKLSQIIEKANSQNNRSGFIEIDSFDYFLYELYLICERQNSDIENIAKITFEQKKAFRINQSKLDVLPVLLNAIKVKSFPKTMLSTKVNIEGEGKWKKLRELIRGTNIVAAFSGEKLLLLGDELEIKTVFSKHLTTNIEIQDVPENIFYHSNSFYLGLLYDFFEKALEKDYGLSVYRRGSWRKFYSNSYLITNETQEIKDIKKRYERFYIPKDLMIYDAFELNLEFIGKELFLLITPTIHIQTKDGKIPDKNEVQFLSNQILSNRYNEKFGKKLNFWLKVLKQQNEKLLFEIGEFEALLEGYYSTGAKQGSPNVHWFENFTKIDEPKIYLHYSDDSKSLIHPLKGLRYFGPLEESYELNTLSGQIKLAIIAPDFGFDKIKNHLYALNNPIEPRSEKDYLIDYPGFDAIYKKHLSVPNTGDNSFVALIERKETENLSTVQFYELIKRKLDKLSDKSIDIDCVIVYIPDEWTRFRELKDDQTYFDLHDSLKLYAVKKNIKLQFIEDDSIKYFDQAKTRWWLSLGLYVKSNGTPWKIKTGDIETAFVGLAYAIKRKANNRVVLGSSQIFDGNGSGLKFLLQPIEKPVFYGKNPFMSKDDAFRLVSNIRNTYHKLDPVIGLRKLVLHKTTRYTRDEIEGISNALEGIDNIELLQIQQFSNWRALKLIYDQNTRKHNLFGYPIERGSILQLDEFSFLLWTHGLVEHQEFNNRKYYQGKRSIPAPLLVRRFMGTDSLEVVASDILKLTKMNWNGAELYKTIPVTIDFSKKLSVMGKQLEDIGNKAYDFRYFI